MSMLDLGLTAADVAITTDDWYTPRWKDRTSTTGGVCERMGARPVQDGGMRFAYADPPYLGCGKLYPEHPDAYYWDSPVAHFDLIQRLAREYPDGWALSASSTSLHVILPMCPPDVRIAAWVKPFAAFKANVRVAYTWEPVIFHGGRVSSKDGAPVTRDHLSQVITLRRGLTGAKPERFCRWVADLLGYVDGDEMVDLFPGTGVMSKVLAQGTLDRVTYLTV